MLFLHDLIWKFYEDFSKIKTKDVTLSNAKAAHEQSRKLWTKQRGMDWPELIFRQLIEKIFSLTEIHVS